MRIGILALQGDVREHAAALGDLGEEPVLVSRPVDLAGLDGMILPGGESTTLSMLLASSGLFGPLGEALAAGLPAFGTCAGLVLLASEVLDGRSDQLAFGRLHCTVRRNGYGRQVSSFETTLPASGVLEDGGEPLPAVFIRAPVVVEVGPEVEVLASLDRRDGLPATPVVCRQGAVLATTFHPELTGDRRLHRVFLDMVGDGPRATTSPPASGRPGTVR